MADFRSLANLIPNEFGYTPPPAQPDLTTIQRLLGIPQVARAVLQNLAASAASVPVGVYEGYASGNEAGQQAMKDFQAKYGYVPTDPAAQQQLKGLGEFLQKIETDYKIPSVVSPSILPAASLTRAAAGQASQGVTRGANVTADKLVQMITRNPEATAPQVLQDTSMPFLNAVAPKSQPKPSKSLLENPNLKNWVAGSEAVKESGEPITLYHATTHDFDTFSLNRANPENHYGKGFYLTDSVQDANANYAGIGPDLEIRIEKRTEQLADELMDMDAEEIAEMAKSLKIDNSLIDVDKIEQSGASPELIREIATKELTTHGGVVMPVFARLRNPVKVGTKDETKFRIDTEFDEAGDVVSESGNGIDLYNSLNDVGRQYDIPKETVQDLWAKISDDMISNEEISAGNVDKIIRDNLYDVYTPDGEYAGPGQFIADVFRDMGFDGIKMDAGKYFGPRQVGTGINVKGMEGVKDATHYIVFEPTQIKSATGNIGTYSLTDPSIIRGVGIGGVGLLGAGMTQEDQY